MGSIDNLARAEFFRPSSVNYNTSRYEVVKGNLNDIADRLANLVGNFGIEGNAGLSIDAALMELVDQLRTRADNVEQLATARTTAASAGESAGNRSQVIQSQKVTAETWMKDPDPMIYTQGEMLYMRLETEASGALATLASQAQIAIGQLPVIFETDDPVSQGTGARPSFSQASTAQGQPAPGYAIRPQNSATQWIPQAQIGDTATVGPGSRATINSQPVGQPTQTQVSFQPNEATLRPGAVTAQVSEPIHEGFTPSSVTVPVATANTAQFDPTTNNGFGATVAKAAAGAAALPAMAKAVARASSAIGPRAAQAAARTGSQATPRAATPRGGSAARTAGAGTARSGATTRSSSSAAPRSGITPRAGQGAATRAGTPARAASPRAGGASARGAGGAAARGQGTTARRATTANTAKTTGTARQGTNARQGVTAPRQGAARSATGRGMMGRPVTARSDKKDRNEQQSHESFTVAELHDETTVSFIESGSRDAE